MIPRMDQTLEITEDGSTAGSRKVLRLKGPLLIANLFDFQTRVRGAQEPLLVIDLTEVPYVDSAGVGVLVGAYVNRDREGRQLVLVGVFQRVRHTLQVTQVERFFQFADKIPES